MSPAWAVYVADDGAKHVTPINDLREHELLEACWCQPFDDDGIIVHNSLDKREIFEHDRKPS